MQVQASNVYICICIQACIGLCSSCVCQESPVCVCQVMLSYAHVHSFGPRCYLALIYSYLIATLLCHPAVRLKENRLRQVNSLCKLANN